MSSFDSEWFGDCVNTFHEEQKQLVYAPRMGLQPQWGGAHPPTFDLGGRSVVDVGGGPTSLLLKSVNFGRVAVVDPAEWPQWVIDRYTAHGIEYWRMEAESDSFTGYTFDEAWIYNCLQHTRDPALVIEHSREIADIVRIFEWIDILPYDGHPHMLTEDLLNEWLEASGFVVSLADNGAHGRAYYGVFQGL